MLYVRFVEGKGRGLFASRKIKKGESIEIVPILLILKQDIDLVEKTNLAQYYYNWFDGQGAIALGNGSLYNHSTNANVDFFKYSKDLTIEHVAGKDIDKDEELTIDYTKDYDAPVQLWFDVKE